MLMSKTNTITICNRKVIVYELTDCYELHVLSSENWSERYLDYALDYLHYEGFIENTEKQIKIIGIKK
tara:strand:- start:2333 stop:2536 length:204 start_codon:yes stop_codon:yes gene_type:complete